MPPPTADLRAVATLPKLDRKQHIAAFVNSQRRFGASYARQGQVLSSKLVRGDVSCINSRLSPSQQEAEVPVPPPQGAFSSPVLKPRTNLPKSKGQKPTNHARVESRDTTDEESEASAASIGNTSIHDSDPHKFQHNAARKRRHVRKPTSISSISSGKKPKKLKRHGKCTAERESEEVEARLAERRDRKRARKSVMAPRPVAHESDGEQRPKKSSKNKRSSRAGSKPKPRLSLGLSLMHGFAADNIGKNRLTGVGPSFGVFNKGKSSSRTQTKKNISKTPRKTSIFEESRFLTKMQEVAATTVSASSCSSSHTAEAESPKEILEDKRNKRPAKKLLITNRSPSRKRRPRDNKSRSSVVVASVASNASEERSIVLEKTTRESEVWDIEKEFVHQFEDNIVEADKSATNRSVSITLDANRWQRGNDSDGNEYATSQQVAGCEEEKKKDFENGDAISPYFSDVIGSIAADTFAESTVTSLAPSHSASQRGYHGKSRKVFVKSNYFDENHNNFGGTTRTPLSTHHEEPACNIREEFPNAAETIQAEYINNMPFNSFQAAVSPSTSHVQELPSIEDQDFSVVHYSDYRDLELENDVAMYYPLSEAAMPGEAGFQDYNDAELFDNGEVIHHSDFSRDDIEDNWCGLRDFDVEEFVAHPYDDPLMNRSLHASRNYNEGVGQEARINCTYEARSPVITQPYTYEADSMATAQDAPPFDSAYSPIYSPDSFPVMEGGDMDRVSCFSDAFDKTKCSGSKAESAADEASIIDDDTFMNSANFDLQFSEGKALLLGIQDDILPLPVNPASRSRQFLLEDISLDPIESTERAVAQGMLGHWFPQKF